MAGAARRWLVAAGFAAMLLEPGACSRRGSSPAASVAEAPPTEADWTSQYHGEGPLTLTVRNGSGTSVFVKIRNTVARSTAAQVPVAAGQDAVVRLDSGSFDVLMKVDAEGRPRYFKGQPLSIPPGATGRALLTVGFSMGTGQSLQEIDASEYEQR